MDLQKYNVEEIDLKSAININGGTDDPFDRGFETGKDIGNGLLVGLGWVGIILMFI